MAWSSVAQGSSIGDLMLGRDFGRGPRQHVSEGASMGEVTYARVLTLRWNAFEDSIECGQMATDVDCGHVVKMDHGICQPYKP